MGMSRHSRRLAIFILAFIPIVLNSVLVVHDNHVEIKEEEYLQEELEVISEYEQAKKDIWEVCIEYGLTEDYKKILAICIVETGWFESYAFKNGFNYCGVTIGGKVQMYSSKERGLEALGITMSYYKGQTVEQMAKKYCSKPEHWKKLVNEIMKGLKNEQSSRQISRRCESL